jgi:type IV secretory pathway TrbL component
VVDQSGRLAEQAQSTIEKVVREQPLAVVIAGMAAGAAVAAAFPLTRVEHEALAGAGQRLSEAASSTSEKLSSAASAAGERLMSAAEERGLNAGGFKEVARDVASTFEDSLSGDDKDRKPPKESTGKQFSGSGHTETVGATGQVSNPTGRSTAKDRPGNK